MFGKGGYQTEGSVVAKEKGESAGDERRENLDGGKNAASDLADGESMILRPLKKAIDQNEFSLGRRERFRNEGVLASVKGDSPDRYGKWAGAPACMKESMHLLENLWSKNVQDRSSDGLSVRARP